MKTCGKKSKGKNLKEGKKLFVTYKKQGGSREKHNGMWGKAKI